MTTATAAAAATAAVSNTPVDPGREAAPIRVILRMEIFPEMAADFEKVWLTIGEAIAAEPANVGQTLVKSNEAIGLYFVFTDWRTEKEFRDFEVSARHTLHRQKLKPYRRTGAMDVTEVVFRLEPADR
ncbi:antibiotic biosynthesis monooxygenase [Streptomyces sp. ISL-43]|uniref:antibiotic biosynthesis monooxygenase family protein n=1 Tax=Streptomyces sp. ISL-43 TaxID=2819183 RepID=UPI001BECAEDC|nr:antibiotic biosynthesis monooxygenase family protein [Streptomyces sp. ISL-43]MBT2447888.1 antibiotic biosynthesis monooxygenase [Streptomyces sp. ISL-43]